MQAIQLYTKAILLSFLLLSMCNGQGIAQEKNRSDSTLKIMTFNIYHGETMKGDFDLDRIARVIVDEQPDLVALQEVDFKTKRARKMDLMTELAIRTKMTSYFAKAMDFDGGEYGEGILSKWSFIEARTIPLSCSPGNEPRSIALVKILLPQGDTIWFGGTHLDHLADGSDRILQSKEIIEFKQSIDLPFILVGDLNDIPSSKSMAVLYQEFLPVDSSLEASPTYPSDDPIKKIDYILLNRENKWSVISTKVIQDSIASDHCALVARIKLGD